MNYIKKFSQINEIFGFGSKKKEKTNYVSVEQSIENEINDAWARSKEKPEYESIINEISNLNDIKNISYEYLGQEYIEC